MSIARVWMALAAVVAVGAVAACTSTMESTPVPGRAVTGPLNARQEARFEVVSGAESITVRSADLGDLAYRVSTPDGGSLMPEVADEGGVIRLSLVHSGVPGPATAEVLLSVAVRWHVRLAGGGAEEVVDFRTGRLTSLELGAGAGRVDVSMPHPQGTLVLRLVGGAGSFVVQAPAGPPAQVRVTAGAGEVTVDGRRHGDIAGGTVFTPDGWDQATDRYDIEAVSGVAELTVERA